MSDRVKSLSVHLYRFSISDWYEIEDKEQQTNFDSITDYLLIENYTDYTCPGCSENSIEYSLLS